jgi:hypothetical protein
MVALIDGVGEPILTGPQYPAVSAWADSIVDKTVPLTMPRYPPLGLPEFGTVAARDHYTCVSARSSAILSSCARKLPGSCRMLSLRVAAIACVMAVVASTSVTAQTTGTIPPQAPSSQPRLPPPTANQYSSNKIIDAGHHFFAPYQMVFPAERLRFGRSRPAFS